MREVVETTRKYRLSCDADFGFGVFERKFDFAMAQSVFTHMTFAQIERCLTALKPVMKPGGKLVFTIILSKDEEVPFIYAYNTPMTRSAHKDMSFYEELGRRIGFRVELLGSAGHVSQQACVATF
jgi:cyclopropane fatty-acyl-phospholipid synthase-like methyltransferase